MGVRFKIPDPPIYWWREGDYGFTWDELFLIRKFITFKTFEDMAVRQQCSAKTIQRRMKPIFAKIGAKNKQDALNIFQSANAPSHLDCD